MRTLIKLAVRNVWRSKWRTLITAASILLAVLLATVMNSIQKGAWDKMIDNVVNYYFGYAQVHQNGYWDEQNIDKAFTIPEGLMDMPEATKGLETMVPRIESFALASYENNTRGILVIGTDPDRENAMSELGERVVEGKYLKPGDDGALIAEGAAQLLKLGIGDTLVLISQGYHGVNAAGKYPVRGLVKFGSPDLNKQLVFLTLPNAQQLYGAEGLITTMAMKINDKDQVDPVVKKLKASLDQEAYEVLDWKEMVPDLVEAQQVDAVGNYIVLFILYVIITFGIFGTVLMMTKEREYEFGVLTAIGMKRGQLGLIIWLETVLIGLIGAIAGMLASFPIVFHFNRNPLDFTEMNEQMAETYEKFGFEPIFPAALEFDIFLNQALIVFVITTIIALYPILKIKRLKPVEAMRH